MIRRIHFLGLATLVLPLLGGAPAAFAAKADAAPWIAGINDVNGDSVPDLAVGDPAQGQIYVFSGADGTLFNIWVGRTLEAEALLTKGEDDTGDVVVGDINGDTVPDIAMDDPSHGQFLVFSGTDGTLLYTLTYTNVQVEASPGHLQAERAGAPSVAADMCVTRINHVQKGGWRTLETFWNASEKAGFLFPAGAWIKVRYGVGIFGFDRQNQKLDGIHVKILSVGRGSIALARMQMQVPNSADVKYIVCGGEVAILPPPIKWDECWNGCRF